MKHRVMTTLVCAAALLPVAAQAQQQQPGQRTLQQMPAAGTQQQTQPGMQQQPGTGLQPQQVQPAQPHPLAQGGFFTMQQTDQMLASNLMGARIVGPGGEDIGNVDDLLMDAQGRTVGVISGIGGFLGIGAQDVAIDVQALEFVLREDLATGAVAPGTAPGGTAPGATAAPGAPATGTGMGTGMGGTGTGTWGWGTWGTAGWTAGQIEFVRVPFTREQLEAAPEFTRLD